MTPQLPNAMRFASSYRYTLGGAILVSVALFSGCAAYTNPVANGIPVRLLPDELLAESRENFEPIDLAMLRQPPP